MGTGDQLPSDWAKRREKILLRDDYECRNCGVIGGMDGPATLEAHHIVPVTLGGSSRIKNLVTLCADCHPKADKWTQVDDLSELLTDREITADDHDAKSEILEDTTILSQREAKIHILKEEGHTHREIAERLDTTKGSIDAQSHRVTKKLKQAANTLRFVGLDKVQTDK